MFILVEFSRKKKQFKIEQELIISSRVL